MRLWSSPGLELRPARLERETSQKSWNGSTLCPFLKCTGKNFPSEAGFRNKNTSSFRENVKVEDLTAHERVSLSARCCSRLIQEVWPVSAETKWKNKNIHSKLTGADTKLQNINIYPSAWSVNDQLALFRIDAARALVFVVVPADRKQRSWLFHAPNPTLPRKVARAAMTRDDWPKRAAPSAQRRRLSICWLATGSCQSKQHLTTKLPYQ